MSNILSFPTTAAPTPAACLGRLADAVRDNRHPSSDVFWLKENAEILGMLTSCGLPLPAASLDGYAGLYAQLETLLRQHPQYYRFWVSICLDLEDLGLGDTLGEELCQWVHTTDLAGAELSDLQRAEARRLLQRRAVGPAVAEGELGDRLRRFIARSDTFAVPNKKAAYELTHIVFYLSDYGRVDPALCPAARCSLEYAGLLAYLDQDVDLLAEVCLAIRYAGGLPHRIWRDTVRRAHAASQLHSQPGAALHDGFHAFLVTGWAVQAEGHTGFRAAVPEGGVRVAAPDRSVSALPAMANWVSQTARHRRRAGWHSLRADVLQGLCDIGCGVVEQAERSSPRFEDFFARFARA